MSKFNQNVRARLIKANERIKGIQRKLEAQFIGKRVKLLTERRGCHSRRKYKYGHEFIVYTVMVEGRYIRLWLSRIEDKAYPSFELSVWLNQVEFIKEPK